MWRLAGSSLLVLILCGSGCVQPRPELTLSSDDSAVKIETMKKICRDRTADAETLGKVVDELSNADSAVRFYAIRALSELTGKTFDYRYYADEEQRRAPIAAWKQWLADNQKAQPTTQATASRAGG